MEVLFFLLVLALAFLERLLLVFSSSPLPQYSRMTAFKGLFFCKLFVPLPVLIEQLIFGGRVV